MRFSWQNLKSDRRKPGIEGRCWLWFAKRRCVQLSWNAPSWDLSFSVAINEGDSNNELHLSLGLVLFTLYLSLPFHRFHIGKESTFTPGLFIEEAREFHVYWRERAIWLLVWGDPMGDRTRGMPWWKTTQAFHIDDWVLGRRVHTLVEHSKHDVLIPMPEGSYPAIVTVQTRTWKRPRWPFPLVRKECSVEIPGGIPHEGKGENSWDCGEDGLWGCGSSGHDLAKAIAHTVESVLGSRQRYGGGLEHRGLAPRMAPQRQAAS